jgi:hypothetical protein
MTADRDLPDERPTSEVGSEGGTPGDVELDVDQPGTGTGSEATETWRPVDRTVREIKHDETGEGRRSP